MPNGHGWNRCYLPETTRPTLEMDPTPPARRDPLEDPGGLPVA